MKKLWQKIKNFKWGYLLFAILFTAGGLCFLSFPEDALKGVRIGIGVTAIVFAVFFMALTLANEERGFRFWAKMVLGGVAAVCGGFMIFSRQGAFEYLTFIAGIYLMIDGAFKLQTAILSKRYRSALWWIMLVLAAAAISFGTALIRVRFDFAEELVKVSKIIGIAFMIDGIQNLLSIGYLYYVEHKTRESLREDLRARGELVTVLDDGTAPMPADGTIAPGGTQTGKKTGLTRAEKRAAKRQKKQAVLAGERHAMAEPMPFAVPEGRETLYGTPDGAPFAGVPTDAEVQTGAPGATAQTETAYTAAAEPTADPAPIAPEASETPAVGESTQEMTEDDFANRAGTSNGKDCFK